MDRRHAVTLHLLLRMWIVASMSTELIMDPKEYKVPNVFITHILLWLLPNWGSVILSVHYMYSNQTDHRKWQLMHDRFPKRFVAFVFINKW